MIALEGGREGREGGREGGEEGGEGGEGGREGGKGGREEGRGEREREERRSDAKQGRIEPAKRAVQKHLLTIQALFTLPLYKHASRCSHASRHADKHAAHSPPFHVVTQCGERSTAPPHNTLHLCNIREACSRADRNTEGITTLNAQADVCMTTSRASRPKTCGEVSH